MTTNKLKNMYLVKSRFPLFYQINYVPPTYLLFGLMNLKTTFNESFNVYNFILSLLVSKATSLDATSNRH